ncbi:hypothetical protein P692DRAFT_20956624 [Suillus brevipes Sb2]|nr:hypothetical protein P692DRAFT_20956624 [Suillus brevipes Sb2]
MADRIMTLILQLIQGAGKTSTVLEDAFLAVGSLAAAFLPFLYPALKAHQATAAAATASTIPSPASLAQRGCIPRRHQESQGTTPTLSTPTHPNTKIDKPALSFLDTTQAHAAHSLCYFTFIAVSFFLGLSRIVTALDALMWHYHVLPSINGDHFLEHEPSGVLTTAKEMPWDAKHNSIISLRAKFQPYAELRQGFWAQYLIHDPFDQTETHR